MTAWPRQVFLATMYIIWHAILYPVMQTTYCLYASGDRGIVLTLWISEMSNIVPFKRLPRLISISKPPTTCSAWPRTAGSMVRLVSSEQSSSGTGRETVIVETRRRRRLVATITDIGLLLLIMMKIILVLSIVSERMEYIIVLLRFWPAGFSVVGLSVMGGQVTLLKYTHNFLVQWSGKLS